METGQVVTGILVWPLVVLAILFALIALAT
jgi:hypothetical protein